MEKLEQELKDFGSGPKSYLIRELTKYCRRRPLSTYKPVFLDLPNSAITSCTVVVHVGSLQQHC